jgi:riboflavin kinase/FMN adenylyltransferase
MLGYRFTVEADIVQGEKLGRTLGFPTANMEMADGFGLAHGIYAVLFRRQNGQTRAGVASFGRRPTVSSHGRPLLETFLFDYSGDLYGESCRVSFFAFLRPEMKFDGLDALTAQMRIDEAQARKIMSDSTPVSALDRSFVFGNAAR